jgi:hypothetical protein
MSYHSVLIIYAYSVIVGFSKVIYIFFSIFYKSRQRCTVMQLAIVGLTYHFYER